MYVLILIIIIFKHLFMIRLQTVHTGAGELKLDTSKSCRNLKTLCCNLPEEKTVTL